MESRLRAYNAPKTKERDNALVADPVQRYLNEVRAHEVLTREEEQVLSREYLEDRNEVLETRLVNANLRLVVKLALEYKAARAGLLDLIQEGNVGLIHAVRKFDPDKGIRLASYAQWWIRAYILKYLMDNHKLVKVGTTQAQRKLFYNLKKEKENLRRQGLIPTPPLLARALQVRESDVIEMGVRMAGRESSIDAPLQDGEKGTLADLIPAEGPMLDDLLAANQERASVLRELDTFSSTLEGRDITIWNRRIVAESPETLQQLGEHFGVSRERARQLEARIKTRLAKFLGNRLQIGGAA
jgi:RNA polymerase sigma-32 factor